MAWLSEKDVHAVLDSVRMLYESADVPRFAALAGQAVLRLVPADRVSYSEWFRKPATLRVYIGPQATLLNGALADAMAHHSHENPLLAHYRRTGRPDVVAFSDFVSKQQLHRIPLYNEYYRHVDVEHQVIVPMPIKSRQTSEVGFALSRRQTDFSQRDRQVLELLQPHLTQALANAKLVERLGAQQSCLEQVLEASGRSIVVLSKDGSVMFASAYSRALLREYFAHEPMRDERLPESVARWLRRETMKSADAAITAPRMPLSIARRHKQLIIRLSDSGENRLLLLEERCDAVDPQALAPLGLTPRQSEVLAWVAQGKTNEEIATIAGARPATVAKHLERIYQKLGVETRTAAAISALSAAGRA